MLPETPSFKGFGEMDALQTAVSEADVPRNTEKTLEKTPPVVGSRAAPSDQKTRWGSAGAAFIEYSTDLCSAKHFFKAGGDQWHGTPCSSWVFLSRASSSGDLACYLQHLLFYGAAHGPSMLVNDIVLHDIHRDIVYGLLVPYSTWQFLLQQPSSSVVHLAKGPGLGSSGSPAFWSSADEQQNLYMGLRCLLAHQHASPTETSR
eukprot:1695670-Amphidinium_carterae.1